MCVCNQVSMHCVCMQLSEHCAHPLEQPGKLCTNEEGELRKAQHTLSLCALFALALRWVNACMMLSSVLSIGPACQMGDALCSFCPFHSLFCPTSVGASTQPSGSFRLQPCQLVCQATGGLWHFAVLLATLSPTCLSICKINIDVLLQLIAGPQ